MNKFRKWATKLELFATSSTFDRDIWVYLGPLENA